MAYTALYRNFRPLKFSEMVGQEHITKTLRNQVIADRVGHAYLFTGGRGTGKTTSAKILSRAINCLNPQEGEPCNECEICKEILAGSLTDVVEMDAASNNGVEDIRTIRDEVNFLPTKAKYRVYIIDEVHMLSTGAFNALLKTLEEPPSHVKFILATTEPQKIPMTILSRCQRFDFKKIPDEDIIKRLKIIVEDSKININEDAMKLIAILSEGHMRDAISILERCSQENEELITIELVKDLVGIPTTIQIADLTKAIIDYDVEKALQVIDEVLKDGKEINTFLAELVKYIKDILIYKSTKSLDIYSKEELLVIDEISNLSSKERLLDIIYKLSEMQYEIRLSTQRTIMFQSGIIRLCTLIINSNNADEDNKVESSSGNSMELINRINNLEKKLNEALEKLKRIEEKEVNALAEEKELFVPAKAGNDVVEITKEENKKIVEPSVDDIWKKVVYFLKQDGNIRLYAALSTTRATAENDLVWEIEFPNGLTDFTKKIVEDPVHKNLLQKILIKYTKKEIHLKYVDGKSKIKPKEKIDSKNPLDDLGIDINIIDK